MSALASLAVTGPVTYEGTMRSGPAGSEGGPPDWVVVAGTVVRGHGVASRAGEGSPYPAGTLEMQIPHFRRLGLNLDRYVPATLNISIVPRRFHLRNPRHTFRGVRWTSLHPPEDFSFSPCRVVFAGATYEGLVYHPHPETKARHFQDASTIEVLAAYIPGVTYGSRVELHVRREEIDLL